MQIFNQGKFNEESDFGEKKLKIKLLDLNPSFIEVAHFENTMTVNHELLLESKKNSKIL